MLSTAAAAELEAAAAELVDEAELWVADAEPDEALAEEPPLEDPLPRASAVAFLEPQMKDWQKVWPARSLGLAAVHWTRHSSHWSEGSVCA
jgi:hypothetical protein